MIPVIRPFTGDREARERIRTSLDESLIVEASAGTGKTTELVERLLRVLQMGVGQIQNVVAVTFTHKAAGELKLRLRQKLDEARQSVSDVAEIVHLEDALKHLEEAFIGTFHSFCAQILRERPVEAVVDPGFVEMAEADSRRLYDSAFRTWFQQKLAEPSPALRRAMVRLAWRDAWEEASPLDRLKDTGWALIVWRDFTASWTRPPFHCDEEIDLLVTEAVALVDLSANPRNRGDYLYRDLRPLREFVAGVRRAEAAARDYDTLEGQVLKLARDLGGVRKGRGAYGDGADRESIHAALEGLRAAIQSFREHADADLAAGLREEMSGLLAAYEDRKRKTGQLDFHDLLLMTRDLLRGNAEVRGYLQERFTHLFVDEFQDTDPLQAEILLLLASDDPAESEWLRVTPVPGKLFLVGDPKQSIYKFRRADLTLYRQICEGLIGRGVGAVRLTHSFRSIRPIQQFVNAAFEPEMLGDSESAQALYSPLEEGGEPIPGQPAIIALPVPKPYGKRDVTLGAIKKCLPDTVVAMVEWLVQSSGWKVRDPSNRGELVAIQTQHIALLFRRFQSHITRDYVRAFENRNIAHLLVGSKSFHDREEIESMRAALSAIEWPGDELSVFAVLKGSLFAIPDGLLMRYRQESGRLHPFRPGRAEAALPDFEVIEKVLDFLAGLHTERNRRPVAATINALLEHTRAHAGFALRPAGHQVLANVYALVTAARNFEMSGGISFRAFVEELDSQAARSDSEEAPVLEEGAEGVRIMTLHKAKGLEFPVVILADMTAKLCHPQPDRYIDASRNLCAMQLLQCTPWELREQSAAELRREEAEGVRVAYVAATRARDLLIVPAVGDEEREGWLQPLNRALYPAQDRWRFSSPAPGCPAFGEASVLERPAQYFGAPEFSVKPGLHKAGTGDHDLVWWDPSKLRLTVGPRAGLLGSEMLQGDPAEGVQRYETWKQDRAQAIELGARKTLDVFAVTDAVTAPEGFAVMIESIAKSANRPAGKRFGTLVHAILGKADLGAFPEAIERLVRSEARMIGASAAESRAAVDAVAAALEHPLLDRARKATRCHREVPVTVPLEGNRVLEGTVDLAFLEDGVWTIVDFKTDASQESKRALYEQQLRWYAYAFSRITGQPSRGVLLGV